MRKWTKLLLAASLIMVMLPWTTLAVQAQEQIPAEQSSKAEVKLTKEQQKVLESISSEILEKRIEMINKYAEFGVIKKDKAKKIIKHMKKHHEKLKENGFVPHWDKHKKKHR